MKQYAAIVKLFHCRVCTEAEVFGSRSSSRSEISLMQLLFLLYGWEVIHINEKHAPVEAGLTRINCQWGYIRKMGSQNIIACENVFVNATFRYRPKSRTAKVKYHCARDEQSIYCGGDFRGTGTRYHNCRVSWCLFSASATGRVKLNHDESCVAPTSAIWDQNHPEPHI